MHIIWSIASNVTNELVKVWCTTERVKRLAGNDTELVWRYQRSNLGQVTYNDKGNNICWHCGSTDKDLRRICGNQYEHPGSAIGYLSERCFSHVYTILEPVGSACLMFDRDMYYMSYVFWWPKVVRSPVWDHRHDEESQNVWEVKIYILEGYIRTRECFWNVSGIFGSTEGLLDPPPRGGGEVMGRMGHSGEER